MSTQPQTNDNPYANKTLLVVEDEEVIRENTLTLLEFAGFKVLGAVNGKAGLELAREHLPDLIVSDILMPVMDGYEMLKALRANPDTASIPIIFLTAKTDRSDWRRGMELGADDYVTKPFSGRELVAVVKNRLQRQQTVAHASNDKLQKIIQTLGFAIPHEMRTPLTGILGYTRILKESRHTMNETQIDEMLDEIYTSGRRLSEVIENYLLFTKLEIQRAQLAHEKDGSMTVHSCDPKPVVAHVANQLARQHKRTDDLELNLMDCDVNIDEADLVKITHELVTNAFKFSEPGQKVSIYMACQDDHLQLTFEDHGRGMNETQIQCIDAFVQHDRLKFEQQGVGLGLAIVRRLAEINHGTFALESTPGEKTMVKLTFSCQTLNGRKKLMEDYGLVTTQNDCYAQAESRLTKT